MLERDPSEFELAAAFRAYLEDAPTEVRPVEFARHFAVAYPHGRTAFARMVFARAPAIAWVLLLAGLLLALVVGGLAAGAWSTAPSPAWDPPNAAALPDATASKLQAQLAGAREVPGPHARRLCDDPAPAAAGRITRASATAPGSGGCDATAGHPHGWTWSGREG